ncbi:ribbon-helix-helix protein, CopG family [Paroceanicella profunda]|uniref:Ribbon-helix-helix protein, CopG family n=1 Tax=Paroceanicella profunda TaxID=2579971 RepID=A0A5B8G0I7_9RHOB|nr:type II toxin-antitoxin system HicB family antitoxin [Paroceanicella profunda]QDL92562.1 ribbon-helix-helix protein, CopG family [Paroceanicella profunda]
MIYWAIVHHDPGSAYGVSFPDVPDCFAAADEEEDLMANAIAALDDYFADGHVMPAASGLEQVRAAVAEDLAEGAFLVQVPAIRRLTKTVRANISMEQGLLEAIDEAAEQLDMNRSAFLAQAARNEIHRTKAA